jgi:lysophospholipase L1-like esterase
LTQGLPEAYIFVASLPNLGQLVAATQSIPAASALWAKGKLCGSLTNASSDSDGGSQRFAQVAAQITGYNEQIDDLCSQFARCIYDGGAVTSEKFDAADISDVDYFHPSTAGQQLLAATTWQSLETGAACIATQSSSC